MSGLTQEYVRKCVDYEPETGALIWRHRPVEHFSSARSWKSWNRKHEGRRAFNQPVGAGRQRLGGRLDGIQCLAHRIIWLWVYGKWPDQTDHIDGNPKNNRLANLRSVNTSENMRNLPALRTNKSGCTGVSWCPSAKKWRVRIGVRRGLTKFVGQSESYDEAVSMRKLAEVAMGYHPNHGRRA